MKKRGAKTSIRDYGELAARRMRGGNKAGAYKYLRKLSVLYFKERDTDPTLEATYLRAINQIWEAANPKLAAQIALTEKIASMKTTWDFWDPKRRYEGVVFK